MACKSLLSLCSIPKTAMRDGWAGAYAKILLPFYGYWFASGAQYTFPQAELAQNQELTFSGSNTPDVFRKDCCSCGACGQGLPEGDRLPPG